MTPAGAGERPADLPADAQPGVLYYRDASGHWVEAKSGQLPPGEWNVKQWLTPEDYGRSRAQFMGEGVAQGSGWDEDTPDPSAYGPFTDEDAADAAPRPFGVDDAESPNQSEISDGSHEKAAAEAKGSGIGNGNDETKGTGTGAAGKGTGAGARGADRGGGGTSPIGTGGRGTAGDGKTAGLGTGTKTGDGTPRGTAPKGGQQTKSDSTREGARNNGVRGAIGPGVEGGIPTGTGLDPSAEPWGTGSVNPALDPSDFGEFVPPGLTQNGDDPNGSLDGSMHGTRGGLGGTTQAKGSAQGTRSEGTGDGSPSGSRQGGEEGNSTQAPGVLDYITRGVGYLNLEWGRPNPNGQSGGAPGGTGTTNLGWLGQLLYIALTLWPEKFIEAVRVGARAFTRAITRMARAATRTIRAATSELRQFFRPMLRSSEKIGWTGVERFDRLMVGTEQYGRWVKSLERKGYSVVERELEFGNPANVTKSGVVEVDPAQFTYVDMLHESRHVAQIERATRQGLPNPFAIEFKRLFEKGAYEYELRLARRFGFSGEYVDMIRTTMNEYWRKARNAFEKSRTMQGWFRTLWR